MPSPAREINLLFTSCGRRVELIRAFKEAYRSLGLRGKIIAVDANPLAPALRLADESQVVPRVDDPDYLNALERICCRGRVDLIIPLTDPELPLFACHKRTLEQTGARVVVSEIKAVAICDDKWLTRALFANLGLATPLSWLPDKIPSDDPALFPLFIKPRKGSGSARCFKVQNREELNFFTGYVPDPIVSEFIVGPEITSDVICDLDGALLGIVSRQRLEVRAGEVSKGVTVYDERITQACAAIARALSAVGPITIQCMMKNDVPVFTEVNARLGGGAPLSIAAGADFAAWLLARAAGIEFVIPPLGTYKRGLYMTRFDESHFTLEP